MTSASDRGSIDDRHWDALVIGGGVNGLAVAWDLALGGASVLLVEKGDWGSGTSAWSSRMVHGGLKYLEKLDVRLVRESLREREWLLQHAPHLVKPLPFMLPFYRGGAHSKLALRAGMIAYDVLSFDKSVPRHRILSRDQVIAELPDIRREGLSGAAVYYDAQVEYSERLCVELLLGAQAAGAVAVNHMRVTGLTVEGDHVVGATMVDDITSEEHSVRATVVVNVTGPWLDDVLLGTSEGRRRWIGGTKGTHLVVPRFPGAPTEAMYYESDDGRPMMILPWLDRIMIGSTDVRFTGDLDTVSADDDELDYILYETCKVFPNCGLTRDSIQFWYTGVRPLPYVDAERTADISRRHEVVDHGPRLRGLISVVGGKLTTFRAVAKHVRAAIGSQLALGTQAMTDVTFPGAGEPAPLTDIPAPFADRWTRLYGARAGELAALYREGDQTIVDDGLGVTVAELLFVIRHESALRLNDVVFRRVMTGWQPDLGASSVQRIAEVMARELHWDEQRLARELADYHHYIRRFRVVEESDAVAAGH
jgi:glycerol-3-phosphate dehydrogenase